MADIADIFWGSTGAGSKPTNQGKFRIPRWGISHLFLTILYKIVF